MMRIFGRKRAGQPPKPPQQPAFGMPPGEEVARSTRATLLHGKSAMQGTLFLTDRRLIFEAQKGDARYMVVPFTEVQSVGLYRWPGATMGRPSSRLQCLCVVTDKDEQVWWDFGEKEEREWLPLVQQGVAEARAAGNAEG